MFWGPQYSTPLPFEGRVDGCLFEHNVLPEGNWGGSAFALESNDPVTIALVDSTFIDNDFLEGTYGSAVDLEVDEPSDITIEGCHFEGNTATNDGAGAALHVDATSATIPVSIVDSVFTGNLASTHGAIHMEGDPLTVEIVDSVFESNVTWGYGGVGGNGGAFHLNDLESLIVSGSSFTTNVAGNGAAIYVDEVAAVPTATIDISDTVFESNGDADYGGAITIGGGDVNTTIAVTVDHSTFSANNAGYGGALFLSAGSSDLDVSLTDTDFESNESIWTTGGAINVFSANSFQLEVDGGSFIGNLSLASRGSAIGEMNDAGPGVITLTDVLMDANEAYSDDRHGSMLYTTGETVVTMDTCTVTRNTGGGVTLSDDPAAYLYSIDTDWGAGADDNVPCDIRFTDDTMYTAFGDNETFTCNVATGCI